MLLAPLNNSIVFKKLFRDPQVLTEFVRDVTEAPVQFEAENIELEKQFTPPIAGIDIHFDIFAEDPKHRAVVEVQRVRYDDQFDRFFHYHMAAILEQQKSYKFYQLQRTVYTIVWSVRASRDKRYQKPMMVTKHETIASDGTKLDLYPHQLIFINPFHLDNSVSPQVRDWLQLAAESVRNPTRPHVNLTRPVMTRATGLIEDQQMTPTEREGIINESEWERNLNNNRDEGRKEGLEEGRKEGIEEGRKEGIEEGRKEGIEEGELRAKYLLARKLLAKGTPLAEVAETVELPVDEIMKL